MPDADLDQAVKALQASAFGCAGERCMAGSVAVPVGRIADDVVEGLCRVGKQMKVGPTDGGANVDMGPLISAAHRDRVAGYLDVARDEGATIALDGREFDLPKSGFLLGPSVVDRVAPTMRLAKEEIFGPVLSVVRAGDLDEALALGRQCEYGNGASIFTRSGWAAREFKRHFNAGMIGINVGVPAPMAWFPFTGWNKSFFGDLHIQGSEGVQFYTQQKMTMTRWFRSAGGIARRSDLENATLTEALARTADVAHSLANASGWCASTEGLAMSTVAKRKTPTLPPAITSPPFTTARARRKSSPCGSSISRRA